jgi:hypothetical protein
MPDDPVGATGHWYPQILGVAGNSLGKVWLPGGEAGVGDGAC